MNKIIFPNYYVVQVSTCRSLLPLPNYLVWKPNSVYLLLYTTTIRKRNTLHRHSFFYLLTYTYAILIQCWSSKELKNIILTLKMGTHSWQPWHSVIHKKHVKCSEVETSALDNSPELQGLQDLVNCWSAFKQVFFRDINRWKNQRKTVLAPPLQIRP